MLEIYDVLAQKVCLHLYIDTSESNKKSLAILLSSESYLSDEALFCNLQAV